MDAHEREAAGRWLREQRTRRGFKTAGDLARALGVDPSRISNYETGKSAVPDDRVEQIAQVLDMDLIKVRRNLGLWVPPSPSGGTQQSDQASDDKTNEQRLVAAEEIAEAIEKLLIAKGMDVQTRQRRELGRWSRYLVEVMDEFDQHNNTA